MTFSGPIYNSWDEAMADPDLDLSKPWAVAPTAAEQERAWQASEREGAPDWSGWQKVGYTEEGSAFRPDGQRVDDPPPELTTARSATIEVGPGVLHHLLAVMNQPCPVCGQDDGRHDLARHIDAGTLNTRPEEK